MDTKLSHYGYCRRCGGKLSSNKKCTVCGAQYIVPKMLIIPAILLLCVYITSASLTRAYNANLQLECYDNEINEMREKCDFYDDEIGIFVKKHPDDINSDIKYYSEYHKYGCPQLKNESISVIGLEFLNEIGKTYYTPCKICHKD